MAKTVVQRLAALHDLLYHLEAEVDMAPRVNESTRITRIRRFNRIAGELLDIHPRGPNELREYNRLLARTQVLQHELRSDRHEQAEV